MSSSEVIENAKRAEENAMLSSRLMMSVSCATHMSVSWLKGETGKNALPPPSKLMMFLGYFVDVLSLLSFPLLSMLLLVISCCCCCLG